MSNNRETEHVVLWQHSHRTEILGHSNSRLSKCSCINACARHKQTTYMQLNQSIQWMNGQRR